MLGIRKPTFPFDSALIRRVYWLIFARLAIILIVALAGSWWISEDLRFSISKFPNGLLLLLYVSVFLTAVYLIWLRFARTLIWQLRSQFLIDGLLITWLVGQTGDLLSPYITFYIILIAIAGFYLGRMDAYIISATCVVCFTGFMLAVVELTISPDPSQLATSRVTQIVGINDAAFLLVGLLSARLADRRKVGEDLKRVEANFANLSVLHERILESLHSGLIATDLAGRIYAVNHAAETILGINANETIGNSVFEIFGDEIREPISSCLGGLQTTEITPPRNDELIKLSRNGSTQPAEIVVSCSVSPLIGSPGGVTGLIVAFQDKTELYAMEDRLRRMDRMAAIGRLAAGLAHEIRNPLGSMSSALQFLSEKAGPDNEDEALMNVVLRESDRLEKIIADFLTFARPMPDGKGNAETGETDAGTAISDCLALLKHDPRVSPEHVIECSLPEDPVLVRINETQFRQVLWNLFQNGIQSMPEGGTLAVTLRGANNGQVKIEVADTGSGISNAEMEHIFEPFHSGTNGTGLGLAIVHKIVTEHRGQIDVESKVGLGSRFSITLAHK